MVGLALAGCGVLAQDEPSTDTEPTMAHGPATVTLKVTSFSQDAAVAWRAEGATSSMPGGQQITPPWSQQIDVERGKRVEVAVDGPVVACEILVDGESVDKNATVQTGEDVRCDVAVE